MASQIPHSYAVPRRGAAAPEPPRRSQSFTSVSLLIILHK